MYVQRNIEARSWNHRCCGDVVSIEYSGCVSVALVIRNAKRKPRIVLSYVASPTVQYCSTLSHTQHNVRKKSY
jgi:hypothetical protein